MRTGALAHRVMLESERAAGVLYEQDGQQFAAHVEQEVLLSAGAINSPQLLMLSGIGPGRHLRSHDIDVAVDLPGVGANLHDHPTLSIIWSTRDASDLLHLALDPGARDLFSAGQAGPLNSALCEVGGFLSTDADPVLPNIQFHTGATAFADGLTLPSTPSFTGTVSLLDPASRGAVRLDSADPGRAPLIDYDLLGEAGDFVSLLAGARAFMEMSTSGPVAAHLDAVFFPTSAHPDSAEFEAAARAHMQTMYHPVGRALTSAPWSIPRCGCTVSKACASSTPR